MNEPQTLGFAHFLGQADAVSTALLLILVAMSAASWVLIAFKGIGQTLRRRRSAIFLAWFWRARSLATVEREIARSGADNPFAHLTVEALQAQAHHAQHGATRLADAGSEHDFLTRTIRKVLDEETMQLEKGLTVLATVGSTAPFVGLFGTVWGIYHALLAIGISGAGTLDKVAGPVGEALLMTAVGLAVAIPAVVGYNAFGRANRVLGARLDGFAHELLTFLTTGSRMASSDADSRATPASVGTQAFAAVPARG